MPSQLRFCPVIAMIAALLPLFAPHLTAAQPGGSATETDSSAVRIIAAPYAAGNSDEGLLLGFGFGANHPPDLYSVASVEFSLHGRFNLSTETEFEAARFRFSGRLRFARGEEKLYPALPVDPKELADAEVERLELNLGTLHPTPGGNEIGPAVRVASAHGRDPEDINGHPVPLETIPLFQPGTLALGGIRLRRHTTSTYRPMNGYILDAVALAGPAWSAEWGEKPMPDAALQLFAATARPLRSNLRLYLRGDARFQLNSPPPLRNFNGGEKNLRGQPLRREAGRRVFQTRAQLHWTVLRDWTWPLRTAHHVLPFFPVYGLELELAPFYDMGVVADPDFGRRSARHGVGAGVHFVIPPELVLRLDMGVSPGGSARFYFTVGEAI